MIIYLLRVSLLSQINFGFSAASILGFLYVAIGIVYFCFLLNWLIKHARQLTPTSGVLYLIQVVFVPIILLCCGAILIFQGWRLDPTLQFMMFLISLIIAYLSIKDIAINAIYRNR